MANKPNRQKPPTSGAMGNMIGAAKWVVGIVAVAMVVTMVISAV